MSLDNINHTFLVANIKHFKWDDVRDEIIPENFHYLTEYCISRI